MAQSRPCPRCGYALPLEARRCASCARRIRAPKHAKSTAPARGTGPTAASDWSAHAIDPVADWPVAAPVVAGSYRSLLGVGAFARSLLAFAGVLAGAAAVAHATRLGLTFADQPLTGTATRAWDAAGDLGALAVAAGVLALVITGVAFVTWGFRAYGNLPALGVHDRRYWTLWTVAGWVVPGANLFVPKLVLDDVWRASSPNLPLRPGRGWYRRPVGDVMHRWWAQWLAGPALAVLVGVSVADDARTLERQRLVEGGAALAAVVVASAAVDARRVVGAISVGQALRAEKVAHWEDPPWTDEVARDSERFLVWR